MSQGCHFRSCSSRARAARAPGSLFRAVRAHLFARPLCDCEQKRGSAALTAEVAGEAAGAAVTPARLLTDLVRAVAPGSARLCQVGHGLSDLRLQSAQWAPFDRVQMVSLTTPPSDRPIRRLSSPTHRTPRVEASDSTAVAGPAGRRSVAGEALNGHPSVDPAGHHHQRSTTARSALLLPTPRPVPPASITSDQNSRRGSRAARLEVCCGGLLDIPSDRDRCRGSTAARLEGGPVAGGPVAGGPVAGGPVAGGRVAGGGSGARADPWRMRSGGARVYRPRPSGTTRQP